LTRNRKKGRGEDSRGQVEEKRVLRPGASACGGKDSRVRGAKFKSQKSRRAEGKKNLRVPRHGASACGGKDSRVRGVE